MNHTEQVKNDSIKEFGSQPTQERYAEVAKQGLWPSEDILIKKYFKPNTNILDIGCGSGRTTIVLHERGYKVTGVDITPEMIATAKKIASSKNLDINYQLGDATKLDFPDSTFDNAIFANNGWVQIPGKKNRQQALNEIFRVLKPNGYFILTAHQRYYSGKYLPLWIAKWVKHYILKPLGIKIEEIDFGDLFFKRNHPDKKIKARQFIHITSRKEVEKQIKNSGFKIVLHKSLGEMSVEDVKNMRGSLSKNYNSQKSPIFYICQK